MVHLVRLIIIYLAVRYQYGVHDFLLIEPKVLMRLPLLNPSPGQVESFKLFSSKGIVMELKGKTAIITGAGSGIGREIAHRFAKAGASIGVADMDFAAAQKVASELKSAMPLAMNVCDEQQVNQGIESFFNTFGCIDILVSNAGIQHIARIEELSLEQWKQVLSVHLDGAFLTTKACLPKMYAARTGSVIFIGSAHSMEASKLKAPYVTAKHGLLGFCRVLAKEAAEFNVKANVVCPGYVKTPLVENQIALQAKELNLSEEEVVKKIMLGNTVSGEFTDIADIAEACLFFASANSLAMTGQSLLVSHGWHMN